MSFDIAPTQYTIRTPLCKFLDPPLKWQVLLDIYMYIERAFYSATKDVMPVVYLEIKTQDGLVSH